MQEIVDRYTVRYRKYTGIPMYARSHKINLFINRFNKICVAQNLRDIFIYYICLPEATFEIRIIVVN